MTKVLAIACKKGGTTKTTVATQIAACLAEQGARVLLIDLDSQHNATSALDAQESPDILSVFFPETPTLADLGTDSPSISLRAAVRPTKWANGRVWLVPGSKRLVSAESASPDTAYNLREALTELRGQYEWIIIDTAPSTGLLTTAALLASDRVLIPVEVQSEDAVTGMVETFKLTRKLGQANSDLQVLGILLSRKQHRRTVCEAIEQELRDSPLAKLVFPIGIREATVLQQARKARKPLSDFAPTAPVLADFRAVTAHLQEAW